MDNKVGHDTLLRQWTMLSLIPREPQSITASELVERLKTANFEVTKRTVERDLERLSDPFPLQCEDSSKPYRWSWMKSGAMLTIPGIDPPTALTFRLVDLFITPLLPPSVRQHLAHHFDAAKRVLEHTRDPKLPAWSERVLVIGRGPQLQPPEIPEAVTQVVYDALLRQQRFRTHYRPRKVEMDAEPREYEVSPLGLVVRDQVIYLVCTLFDYEDIRQLALHRMSDAELVDKPAAPAEGFDLREYVKQGHFDYPVGGEIELEMAVAPDVARHMIETPVSENQTHTDLEDGRILIKATVLDTAQLRWWLMSFGAGVEVRKPAALREELSKKLQDAAELYS